MWEGYPTYSFREGLAHCPSGGDDGVMRKPCGLSRCIVGVGVALSLVVTAPSQEHDHGKAANKEQGKPVNRLGKESSPYLRQHQHNPVDWYPWGPEALALAKKLDKPIFLSIGYSACHWCHVMAAESFAENVIARSGG